LHKKNLYDRLRVLSRPTGKPQWAKAVRSIVLMLLAALVAKFLGLDNGIQAIMIITLLATIMMDISLPLRKVIPLAVIGLFMTILAFTSASLGLSSVYVFIMFTVIWSFFALSTYIFGESVGFFGFIIFVMYFIAVIIVNNKSTTPDWIIYSVLAFLIASILLIPRILKRKQELRKMVAIGFIPQSPLKAVLATNRALSGIPLDSVYYEIFKLGSYLTGFRGYGGLLYSRISKDYQEKFREYLDIANETSSQIANSIIKDKKQVNLQKLDKELSGIDQGVRNIEDDSLNAFLDVAYQMGEILRKSAELLSSKVSGKKLKIDSPQTSLIEVFKANFNLKNMYIRHALRFTLAMTIGLLLVYLTHDRDAIWVTMGILIIIKPDITSTVNNMVVRVFFNVLAIIFAIILGFIFPHQILLWLAFFMLFFFRAFFPNYMGLSVMALTIFVVFIWPTGTVFDNAVARLVDICLGAIIAFICAYVILPSRVTVDLPVQAAKTIKANREYLKNVLVDPELYSHERAVKFFNHYMLEESNLEAAIKKLKDFFIDVSRDVFIYQDLAAANHKLSADISALATFLESKEGQFEDIPKNKPFLRVMDNIMESIEKSVKPLKTPLNILSADLNGDTDIMKNLEQYLDWIISDIHLIQETVDSAADIEVFKKYRNLS
jgi:hypothetical protein